MRFDVNLASHPYEDAGDFYRRWGTVLAALLLVTLVLVGVAVHEWMSTRSISKQIARIHKQIDDLDDQKNKGQAILNRAENRSTRDRSNFVNELIDLKSFSWTLVMADMESLMPTRIRIVSIQPERDKNGQIQVKITAGGDAGEKGVELLRNMEKSRYFHNTVLRAITYTSLNGQQLQAGVDLAKFELDAYYIPHLPERVKTSHENKSVTGSAGSGNPLAVPHRPKKQPALGIHPIPRPRPITPARRQSTGG
jgi:type IV pilus assembly protein PilN